MSSTAYPFSSSPNSNVCTQPSLSPLNSQPHSEPPAYLHSSIPPAEPQITTTPSPISADNFRDTHPPAEDQDYDPLSVPTAPVYPKMIARPKLRSSPAPTTAFPTSTQPALPDAATLTSARGSPSQPTISDAAFEAASQRLLSSELCVNLASSSGFSSPQREFVSRVTPTDVKRIPTETSPCKPIPAPTKLPTSSNASTQRRLSTPPRTSVPSLQYRPVRPDPGDVHSAEWISHPSRNSSSLAVYTPDPVDTPGNSPPMEHPLVADPYVSSVVSNESVAAAPISKGSSPSRQHSPASPSEIPHGSLKNCTRSKDPVNPNRNVPPTHSIFGPIHQSQGAIAPEGTSKAQREKLDLKKSVPLGNSANKIKQECARYMSKTRRRQRTLSVFDDDCHDQNDRKCLQDKPSHNVEHACTEPLKPPRASSRARPGPSFEPPSSQSRRKMLTVPSVVSPSRSKKNGIDHADTEHISFRESSAIPEAQQPQAKKPRGRPLKSSPLQPSSSRAGRASPDGVTKRHHDAEIGIPGGRSDDSDFEVSPRKKRRYAGSTSAPRKSDPTHSDFVSSSKRPQRNMKTVDYSNLDNDIDSDTDRRKTPRRKKPAVADDGPIGSHGRRLPKLKIERLSSRKHQKSQELPERLFSQMTGDELAVLRLAFIKHYPTPPNNFQAQAQIELKYGITMTRKMVQMHWKHELEPWSNRWWEFYGRFNNIAREQKLLKRRDRDPTIKETEAAKLAEKFYEENGSARIKTYVPNCEAESNSEDSIGCPMRGQAGPSQRHMYPRRRDEDES